MEKVSEEELSRARNMLRGNLLTQLESRMVLFEDIGRQILTYGHRKDPKELCKLIESVTVDDIMRVAKKAMSQAPSISAVGEDLRNVPTFEQIKHIRVK